MKFLNYIILAGSVLSPAFAQDLTIPPKGYNGTILNSQLIKRTNHNFPLSDQSNNEGWKKIPEFSDEFDCPALNQEKWHPKNPSWSGREPTQFHPANVSFDNGELVMKINGHGNLPLKNGFDYSAGYIRTKESKRYGYFEMEAKLMDAPWVSGFWLTNEGREWWTEIDICENCPGTKGRSNDLSSNVHVFRAPKEHGLVTNHFSLTQKHYFPQRLQDDYHVWGLEWNKDIIRFYIDGYLFREIQNTHWHQSLYINLNNESNTWFGAIPDERIDREYRVKYVRVWDKQTE